MRQFLLFVFILLIPCFVLWTVASAALAVPAIGLTNIILSAWFPDVVSVVYVSGAEALLMTRFTELNGVLVPAAESQDQIGFVLNTRILSYSIPFYTALHFATHRSEYLGSFVWGVLVLYPMIILGLICLGLQNLMVNLGGTFFDQAGVFVPHAYVIAILYQFNTLIVPTLAPVLVWAWQSRDTPLIRSVLDAVDAVQKSSAR